MKSSSSRNSVGAPPWSADDRDRVVQHVQQLAHQRAADLDLLPLGPLAAFVGYDGAELASHLERRHRQGCLICGAPLATDERFEICCIDPLHQATGGATLQTLMALTNIGLAHVDCKTRQADRPLR